MTNLIFLITAFVTCCVAGIFSYEWLCRFSERSPSDILPFLQKIDLEVLYGVFHPEAEDMLRRQLPRDEFRQMQWKRSHLAIHYCNLLTANSRILQGWTRYARKNSWEEMSPAVQTTVLELRTSCMQCRLSALVIRFRLRWWLLRMSLLPWTAPPSFKNLLRLG